ncbi:HAD family hydrolase [Mycoplasmopsis ciconiae]|uniref:HAD family hydrolase n=1 Tax=Mycoplasmopsis ciconiae TaxID=561067 RepID=A0ABU7MM16_9BACT|nr:HAD family hydrolase [Mycoplasmopsis ciconiae]
MSQKKIIFYDLDKTSLDAKVDNKSAFSEYTINVIQQAQQKLLMIPSTGRGVNNSTFRILDSIKAKTYILWNGAKIFYNDQEIFSKSIDKNAMSKLFNLIKEQKVISVFNSDFRRSAFTKKILPKIASKFYGDIKFLPNSFDVDNIEVFKVIIWDYSKKKIHKLQKEWSKILGDFLNVSLSGHKNNILEITHKDVSKGNAEVFLANYLNIDTNDCVHIGDSMNDASTKGKIGMLIALNNSVQDLKNIADKISPFNYNEYGFAKEVEQIIENY